MGRMYNKPSSACASLQARGRFRAARRCCRPRTFVPNPQLRKMIAARSAARVAPARASVRAAPLRARTIVRSSPEQIEKETAKAPRRAQIITGHSARVCGGGESASLARMLRVASSAKSAGARGGRVSVGLLGGSRFQHISL